MSRQINPMKMTPEDVEYVRVRPTILREFAMQGFGNPLDPDYEYLVTDGDVDPEKDDEPEDEKEDSDGDDGDDSDDDGDDNPDAVNGSATVTEGQDVDYDSWNKDRLKAEIDRRNTDREGDDVIVPASKKNAALAFALHEDDKKSQSE